jgi:hypothetical protein
MKTGIKATAAVLALALFLGAGAPHVRAQQGGDGPRRNPEAALEALEALLIVSLKRDLQLDTAAAVDLATRVRHLLQARQQFVQRQSRLRKELREAVDTANPDGARIDGLIQSIFQARAQFAAEQQQLFNELASGMEPLQRGRLFASLERFDERVRKHLRRFDERGGRRRDRDRTAEGAAAGEDASEEDEDL